MAADDEKQRRTYSAPGPTARAVGKNVARLRAVRSLTTTALSKELKKIGIPLQATAITRMEGGERRPTVDELVALAVVLGVHPNSLLLPHEGAGEFEITGAGTVPARDAWKWANGRQPLLIPEDDDGTARVDFQRYAHPKGVRTYPVGTQAGNQFAEDDGLFEALEAMGAKRTGKANQEDDE